MSRDFGEGTFGSGVYGALRAAAENPAGVGFEEIAARRAFPRSQALLAAAVFEVVASAVEVGWHGSSLSESGAFAVVRRGGPFEELVGEVLRVATETDAVFVVALESADVTEDLSLARRPFFELGRLSAESIRAEVGIVT